MKQKSTLHLTGGKIVLIFIFIQGALTYKKSYNPWKYGYPLIAAYGFERVKTEPPMDMNQSGSDDDKPMGTQLNLGSETLQQLFTKKNEVD